MASPLGRMRIPQVEIPRLKGDAIRFGLAVGALAFAVSLVVPFVGVAKRLELATQDLRLRLRGERPVHPGISIIAIDEPSLKAYGNSWPIARDQYAVLLADLKDRGVRSVGMDLLFVGPDKIKPQNPDEPTNDEILAAVIARDPRIVNGVYFPLTEADGQNLVPIESLTVDPLRSLWLRFTTDLPAGVELMRSANTNFDLEEIIAESTAVVGHVGLYQDVDGVSRAVPLFINHQGRAFPALALLMAARYLGADWRLLRFEGGHAVLPYPGGTIRIPVDRHGRVLISFPGEEQAFRNQHSFHAVMREIADRAATGAGPGGADAGAGAAGQPGGDPFRDKVVLVCNTAATSAISDFGPTPFKVSFPLAYAHASVLNSILRNDYIQRVPRSAQVFAWAVTAIVLGLLLAAAVSPVSLALLALVAILLYLVAGWSMTTFGGSQIEIVPPVIMIGMISIGNLLRGYILRDRQRRAQEQELAVAKRIQQDLLPKGVLTVRDVEVSGVNLPCFAVGGDYFDYFNLSDGRIALAIADVSGKGVPAAILMSNLQAILRAECARGTNVPQVPTQANRQLMESMAGNSKFVTFFYGALDPHARRLSYSNAGHNPPLVVRADGRIEELSTGGLILGVFPMAEYDEGTITLEPGDVVLLFTDGVTEAESRNGLYGDERLHDLMRRMRHEPARRIADAICDDVASFSHGLHQSDDVTIVVVKVAGVPETAREAEPAAALAPAPLVTNAATSATA
ncbi:MAG: SpoIIE family protein phosphatase [Candidatus Eiseniibacteriota bacterium]